MKRVKEEIDLQDLEEEITTIILDEMEQLSNEQ